MDHARGRVLGIERERLLELPHGALEITALGEVEEAELVVRLRVIGFARHRFLEGRDGAVHVADRRQGEAVLDARVNVGGLGLERGAEVQCRLLTLAAPAAQRAAPPVERRRFRLERQCPVQDHRRFVLSSDLDQRSTQMEERRRLVLLPFDPGPQMRQRLFAVAAAQREESETLVRELRFALLAHGFGVAARRFGEVLLALGHEAQEEPRVHELGIETHGLREALARAARGSFQTLDEPAIEKARAVPGIERQAALELHTRKTPLAFDEEREPAVELFAQASAERPLAREEPGAALRAIAMIVEIGRLAARADHGAVPGLAMQALEAVGARDTQARGGGAGDGERRRALCDRDGEGHACDAKPGSERSAQEPKAHGDGRHAQPGDEESDGESVETAPGERGEEAEPQESEPDGGGQSAGQGLEPEMERVQIHAPPSERGENDASAQAPASASAARAQPSRVDAACVDDATGIADFGQSTARMPRPSADTRIAVEARARIQGPRLRASSGDSTRLRFHPTTRLEPAIPHDAARAAAATDGDPASRKRAPTDAPQAASAVALANRRLVTRAADAKASAAAPAASTGAKFTARSPRSAATPRRRPREGRARATRVPRAPTRPSVEAPPGRARSEERRVGKE